jgi:hypothetical protein
MINYRPARRVSCALLFVASVPQLIQAQASAPKIPRHKLVAVNVILGAATGGLGAVFNGGSFFRGALKGSVGGAGVYAGKCIIAQKSLVTDWLGRATVAVGSSAVRDAALNKPILQQLIFPVGPFNLYRDNRTKEQGFRVNVSSLAVAGYWATQDAVKFELATSLKRGQLVFRGSQHPIDFQGAGVLLLRTNADEEILAHELTHAAQDNFLSTAWEEPIEGALLNVIPGGRAIHNHVDFGILEPLWAIAISHTVTWNSPWEKEAWSFTKGC